MTQTSARMVSDPSNGRGLAPRRLAWSTAMLSVGFALTGTGTVLPGVLLPVLSAKWHLHDDGSGLLLFLELGGSSAGAFLSGLNRIRSMAIGYLLLVASCLDLVLGHANAPFIVFFIFGVGLGMAMTSTSLLFSDRWGDERAAKLEWLNFVWSLGATTCPLIALPFIRGDDIHRLFLLLTVLFALMFVWIVIQERGQSPAADIVGSGGSRMRIDILLIAFAFWGMCVVGVESSLSGWLTTYSHRTGMSTLAGSALATSLFWLGEMVSRLTFSTPLLKRIGRERVLVWGIRGLTAAACLLILAPQPWIIIPAAGLAGIFTGPLYPILLSYLLERSARGWFFAVAGAGSALFPWFTGLISANLNSLRLGLLVPCVGGVLMLMLGAVVFRSRNGGQTA